MDLTVRPHASRKPSGADTLADVALASDVPADRLEVEILFTADCPNVADLHSFLVAQPGVTVIATELEGDGPVPCGFAGSPTVLFDGVDPFGGRPVEAAACALSPPTVADLAAELERRRPR